MNISLKSLQSTHMNSDVKLSIEILLTIYNFLIMEITTDSKTYYKLIILFIVSFTLLYLIARICQKLGKNPFKFTNSFYFC